MLSEPFILTSAIVIGAALLLFQLVVGWPVLRKLFRGDIGTHTDRKSERRAKA